MTSDPRGAAAPSEPSRHGIVPTLLLVAIVAAVVILIVSNPDSALVTWAGFEWEAPLWLVLTATFAAGAVGGKLLGWLWRVWRKRRRRLADEREVLRRHAGGQGG